MKGNLIERLKEGEVLALATKCKDVSNHEYDEGISTEIILVPDIAPNIEIFLQPCFVKEGNKILDIFHSLKRRKILYVQGGERSLIYSGTDPLDTGRYETSACAKIYTLYDMKPIPSSKSRSNNPSDFNWYGVFFNITKTKSIKRKNIHGNKKI